MPDLSLGSQTRSSSSTVKSAERLLDVLELLSRAARPLPTMTIARECSIPKSSAHHLLNVMRDRRFVTYYETERAWGIGVAAFEVGSAYLRFGPLARSGRTLLTELTERTGETSHLATLHGSEVLYIDKQQPTGQVARLVTEVGVRLPAHLTAVGRAMLAELPEDQVRALYRGRALQHRTGTGPATVDELVADLADVRGAGLARDDEMVTPGISCVAAPVFSHDGEPAAAIGVTFVTAQRSPAEVGDIGELVRQTSARLSRELGYAPQPAEALR
jgi:DNA-binding IclR family transcriptional regulator